MKYFQPFDQSDPNAPYVDGDAALGQAGSIPRAKAIEAPQREIVKVIEQAGIDPDGENFGQLWEALQTLRGSRAVQDTSATPNVITVAPDPAITAHTFGLTLLVQVANTNTGPVTITVNSLVSRPVRRPSGRALQAGDLQQGQLYLLGYVNAGFQVLGLVPVRGDFTITQNSLLHGGRDTGSVNALAVVNPSPAITELTPFLTIIVQPIIANTGAATIDVAGLGPKPIVRGTGTPLSAGDLSPGALAWLTYDGASFQLIASSSLYGAGGNVALVKRPTNVSPAVGATNVSPTTSLVGSTYLSLYGVAQGGAEWRVANDPDMTTGLLTYSQSGAGTSYTLPNGAVPANATRYWQTRYKDADNVFSDWSQATAFTTGATANIVNQPTLTSPADGEPAASVRPTLVSSAFATTGDADTHAASQWEIARDAGFQNIVYPANGTPVDDTTNLTSFTLPANAALTPQLDYYGRVRHKGATKGYSAWSNGNRFRTQAAPDRPTVTAPVDGAINVSRGPTITTSAFSMPGGGVHAATQYQVSTVPNFATTVYDSGDDTVNLTSKKLPAGTLALDTPYYVRVRHKESGGTYSPWSLVNAFRTAVSTPISDVFAIALSNGTNANSSITTGIDGTDPARPVAIISRALRGSDAGRSPADPATLFHNSIRGAGKFKKIGNGNPGVGGEAFEQTFASGAGLLAFTQTGFNIGTAAASMNEQFVPQYFQEYKHEPGFCVIKTGTFNQPGPTDIDLSDLGTVGEVWVIPRRSPTAATYWLGWHRSVGNYTSYAPDTQNVTPVGGGTDTQPLTLNGTTLRVGAQLSGEPYDLIAWTHNETPNSLCFCNYLQRTSAVTTVSLPFRPALVEIRAIGNQNPNGFQAGGYTQPRMTLDTARGFGAGLDRVLMPSTINAEQSSADVGYVIDNGFVLTGDIFLPNVFYAFRAIRSA